jgi:hypothetical protein
VIRREECNKCTYNIVNAMRIPELTLRTIRKQNDKIKDSFKGTTMMMVSKITQIRAPFMEKLERILAQ